MGTIKRIPEYDGMTLPFDRPASIAGQLDVLRCLGLGRVGTVYLCRNVRDPEQLVALKVLSPIHLAAGPDDHMFMRFRNEILSMFRVRHENVVQIYEYICEPDLLAYSMEYVDGGTLQAFLEERESVDLHIAVEMMVKLCAGTQAIHDAGIIHRDLKPENILLSADRKQLKITDFGVSFSQESPNITAHGDAVGTVRYLSPEYLERGITGAKGDIYALGVIAYYMTTGVLPHYEAGIFHTVSQKISTDPPAPHLINRECPHSISILIQRAMARDPEERFPTAEAFKDALRANLNDLGRVSISPVELHRLPSKSPDISGTVPDNTLVVSDPGPGASIGRFVFLSAVGMFLGAAGIFAKTFFFQSEPTYQVADLRKGEVATLSNQEAESKENFTSLVRESSSYSEWVLAGGGTLSCVDPSVSACVMPTFETREARRAPLMMATRDVQDRAADRIGSSAQERSKGFEVVRAEPKNIPAVKNGSRNHVSPTSKSPAEKRSQQTKSSITVVRDQVAAEKVSPPANAGTKPFGYVSTIPREPAAGRVVPSVPEAPPIPEKFLSIHASFVERFANFIDWSSRSAPGTHLDVCVFSSPKMHQQLSQRLSGKATRDGKTFRVRSYSSFRQGNSSNSCDVAFLGGGVSSATNEALLGQGAVTVTEGSSLGVFGFLSDSHKVRFSYNERAAKGAGVTVQPIVQRLASRVIR